MTETELSNEELRQAAAEAGLSPEELRTALVERKTDAVANLPTNEIAASGRIKATPDDAVGRVRAALERRSGASGHRQGEGRADILDEARGLTYRISGTPDGADGALVRVEVDSSKAAAVTTLMVRSLGAVAVVALISAFAFGSFFFGGVAAGIAVMTGLVATVRGSKRQSGAKEALALAQAAVLEAEG